MAKRKDLMGIALLVSISAGFGYWLGMDLYKRVAFKENRPEIIQEVKQTDYDQHTLRLSLAVKQDPFQKYPKRQTYPGDKETVYIKQKNGDWLEHKCVWADKGWYDELAVKDTRLIKETEIPGKPKNAIEIILDLDPGEEYAEAAFFIENEPDITKIEAERWASEIKHLFKSNYKQQGTH